MTDVAPRPLVLIQGFGGPEIGDEQHNAYLGYNDGTVYPGKRGENYICKGFLLRASKSDHYRQTNVIATPKRPPELRCENFVCWHRAAEIIIGLRSPPVSRPI